MMNEAKVRAVLGPPPKGRDGYRAAKRLEPVGKAGIEAIRAIAKGGSYAKVNEVMVDLFSARAIVAVYDALNETNRARLERLPVARVADLCFRAINYERARA
jgi:hypothetical protein